MKPSIKYATICLLYYEPDGLWEDEVYYKLKPYYRNNDLCAIRDELNSFCTLGWIKATALSEVQGKLIRKYKFSKGHTEFLLNQMDPKKILDKATGGRLEVGDSV